MLEDTTRGALAAPPSSAWKGGGGVPDECLLVTAHARAVVRVYAELCVMLMDRRAY